MKKTLTIDPKSKLNELEPVIENWLVAIERYIKIHENGKGDLPYWWNERANVGFLAAATYLTPGFCSLEEYPLEKSQGDNEDSKYSGRNDLYIANEKTEFYLEAKAAFPMLETLKNNDTELKIESDSKTEAKKLGKSSRNKIYAALSFIVPRIKGNIITPNDKTIIKNLIMDLQTRNCIVASLFFSSELPESVYEGITYPGVIMCINSKI